MSPIKKITKLIPLLPPVLPINETIRNAALPAVGQATAFRSLVEVTGVPIRFPSGRSGGGQTTVTLPLTVICSANEFHLGSHRNEKQ